MAKNYDVLVIGGGSNGLVTAAYLAKAGRKVLLLEQREALGGTGAFEEFAPGFRFSTSPSLGWLPPKVIGDLNLRQHGFDTVEANPTVFAPLPDGDHLMLWQDVGQTTQEVARFSKRDGERWPEFTKFISRAAGILEQLYLLTPPDGLNVTPGEIPPFASLGLDLRRMGDRDMMEFIRALPMAAWDFFDDWFEGEALKGTLAANAVSNLRQGPRSGGTTFLFLHHHVGARAGSIRPRVRLTSGVGGLGVILSDATRAFGVEVRSGARVVHILSEDGHASGVVLEDGEEIRARRIASSLDPASTFLNLVDPLDLPPTFIRAVRNIRSNGSVAIINLALGERPEFAAMPGDGPHLRGTISISPTMETIERAYDATKYGEISTNPILEVHIPSIADPGLAPPGQHVMTIHAQFAPYRLRNGAHWDDSMRDVLFRRVMDTLAPYAPNVESTIQQAQIVTPLDLENAYGLHEGHLYHGELMLDQFLFMRPVPGYAQYRSPLPGLYLCGAGAHPGGGVNGVSGYNAAREIIRDIRRNK